MLIMNGLIIVKQMKNVTFMCANTMGVHQHHLIISEMTNEYDVAVYWSVEHFNRMQLNRLWLNKQD